jgi:hypothetical protein
MDRSIAANHGHMVFWYIDWRSRLPLRHCIDGELHGADCSRGGALPATADEDPCSS